MRIYVALLETMGMRCVGVPRYISSRARFDDIGLVTLCDGAVISERVVLLTHDYSITTGLAAEGRRPPTDQYCKSSIRVGRNSFIGYGSILLPGTVVGDNTIIGAGSVVSGVIDEDSIYAGNPARRLGPIVGYASRALARADFSALDRD